ncbi:hypothetical protein ACFL4K_02485 [Candidatus Neomarinimicrobiota bacterium]
MTIFGNIKGNGRLSVSLGNLLSAVDREDDAISVQYRAAEIFFSERRYHLSLEEGHDQPVMLTWDLECRRSRKNLVRCIIQI